ncbi:MAG: phosphoribosyltransferase family protein [Candidatus Nitrosocosmicus sp.]|nr:hypothetical protein [Candidatus Nitrosocosmicus sp.]
MVEIEIPISDSLLRGNLINPKESDVLVIFVHGSGSDRFSIRNNYIARTLNSKTISTLVIDLLTNKEKQKDLYTKKFRYDIEFLTRRLIAITNWVINSPFGKQQSLVYFGSSTGSAAAFNAATYFSVIKSIISRGGRLDLVKTETLEKINIPVLMIVGQWDKETINVNRLAYQKLANIQDNEKKMIVIPGASHFFEEKGKIEEVINISLLWIQLCLLQKKEKFEYKQKFLLQESIANLKNLFRLRLKDRRTAGMILGKLLLKYKKENPVAILGIPRGGVIVADSIANIISPNYFRWIVSKRLRSPNDPEKAIGAVGPDGSAYLSSNIHDIPFEYILKEISRQLERINIDDFGCMCDLDLILENCTVILVDDGSHTGSTLIAASRWIRKNKPKKLIIAVPVLPRETLTLLEQAADNIEFIIAPKNFTSVESYYQDFDQVQNLEILKILEFRKNQL